MKYLKCLTAAILSLASSALFAMHVDSTGDIVPGEWNVHYYAGIRYAEENKIPMVVVWGKTTCGYCTKIAAALDTDECVAWAAEKKYVLIHIVGTPDQEAVDGKAFAKHPSSTHLPYICVYYPDANGAFQTTHFIGRPGEMLTSGGSLARQFINSVELAITDAKPSGGGSSSSGTTKSVPSEWTKARSLYGLVFDADGLLQGCLTVKAGKANKKTAISKVKVTYEPLVGRKRTFKQVSIDVSAGAEAKLDCAGFGSVRVNFANRTIVGTLSAMGTELPFEGVELGGSLANVSANFRLLNWPETLDGMPVLTNCLPKASPVLMSGRKIKVLGSKGRVKYNRGKVVASGENLSMLKLSYKFSSGEFSGSFKVYVLKDGKKLVKKTAKVYGYVVGGVGYGLCVISGVDSVYPVEIATE